MLLLGCDNDSNDSGGGQDSSLNGTWIRQVYDHEYTNVINETVINFDSGDFESSQYSYYDYDEASKVNTGSNRGTYSTNGNKMTTRVTFVYFPVSTSTEYYGLESKWYKEDELKAALMAGGMTEKDYNEVFGEFFKESTGDYSVNGNTLIFKDMTGAETKFTKR